MRVWRERGGGRERDESVEREGREGEDGRGREMRV